MERCLVVLSENNTHAWQQADTHTPSYSTIASISPLTSLRFSLYSRFLLFQVMRFIDNLLFTESLCVCLCEKQAFRLVIQAPLKQLL